MRGRDAQVFTVRMECVNEGLRMLPQRHPCDRRRLDRAIVHIGQVHHVEHVISRKLEKPSQEVFEEKGPEVADMGVVPDGRAARVHGDPWRGKRFERFDGTGERVEQAKRHAVLDGCGTGRGRKLGFPPAGRQQCSGSPQHERRGGRGESPGQPGAQHQSDNGVAARLCQLAVSKE